jgi:hypothetical protein
VPGPVGGATFDGGFAVDLLQMQLGEMCDSIFGCTSFDCDGEPGLEGAVSALNLPFICFAF